MITYKILTVEEAKKLCLLKFISLKDSSTISIMQGREEYERHNNVKLCVLSLDQNLQSCVLVPETNDKILLSERDCFGVISDTDLYRHFSANC